MYSVVKLDDSNKDEVKECFIDLWEDDFLVTRGNVIKFDELQGFVAIEEDEILGFITYKEYESEVEITSLNSFIEKKGIGNALLKSVINHAIENDFQRVVVITTNDNYYALKYYQRIGFSLCNLHINAVNDARNIKDSIPLYNDFIKIEHEIELEMKF